MENFQYAGLFFVLYIIAGLLDSFKESKPYNPVTKSCLEKLLESYSLPFSYGQRKTIYYIKFVKNGSTYYKIGITENSLENRFMREYNFKIVDRYTIDTEYAESLERKIKDQYSHSLGVSDVLLSGNSEVSKIDFLGCFS